MRQSVFGGFIGAALFFAILSLMGALPAALTTFTSGTIISSSDVNSNFTKLYTPLNGNIDNANVLDNSLTGQDFNTSSYLQTANITATSTFRLPNSAGDPDAVTGALKLNTSTGKLRLYDGSGLDTVAALENFNTWTAAQTFNASPILGANMQPSGDDTVDIGGAGLRFNDMYAHYGRFNELPSAMTVSGANTYTANQTFGNILAAASGKVIASNSTPFYDAYITNTRSTAVYASILYGGGPLGGGNLTVANNLIGESTPNIGNSTYDFFDVFCKRLNVDEGSNANMGTLTANGTTGVVVSTTRVTANSRIFLTCNTPGGTPGVGYIDSRSAGFNFTFKSSAGDTSTWAWLIVEPY